MTLFFSVRIFSTLMDGFEWSKTQKYFCNNIAIIPDECMSIFLKPMSSKGIFELKILSSCTNAHSSLYYLQSPQLLIWTLVICHCKWLQQNRDIGQILIRFKREPSNWHLFLGLGWRLVSEIGDIQAKCPESIGNISEIWASCVHQSLMMVGRQTAPPNWLWKNCYLPALNFHLHGEWSSVSCFTSPLMRSNEGSGE